MHALMHTQGVIARPWRADMRIGAAPLGSGVALYVTADKPWEGTLVFDIPRHREYLGFRKDWPRMNTLPEWFTVEPNEPYEVAVLGEEGSHSFVGSELHQGLAVEVKASEELRLTVLPD